VLSVVAQQVLAINNAKRSGGEMFLFPGDPQSVRLEPACGFFITMNPGVRMGLRVGWRVGRDMLLGWGFWGGTMTGPSTHGAALTS
jgi:hypothetical protein